jgi:hypothetical protein
MDLICAVAKLVRVSVNDVDKVAMVYGLDILDDFRFYEDRRTELNPSILRKMLK